MNDNKFDWNSIDHIPMAPRWSEILVIIIGIPVILISLYFILPSFLDNKSSVLHVIILIVFTGTILIFRDSPLKGANTTEKEHHTLKINVDKNIVTCSFRSQTTIFDLYKLDWDATRITPEKLTKSLVIAELNKEAKYYPIFFMKEAERRELWKCIIKYRPS